MHLLANNESIPLYNDPLSFSCLRFQPAGALVAASARAIPRSALALYYSWHILGRDDQSGYNQGKTAHLARSYG